MDETTAPEPETLNAAEPEGPKPSVGEIRHAARVERSASRLAVAQAYAAEQADQEAARDLMKDARVAYVPRRGEPGFKGTGVLLGRVEVAHNAEAADLVLDDGYVVVSAIRAGCRDKAAGTPGTFEVIG